MLYVQDNCLHRKPDISAERKALDPTPYIEGGPPPDVLHISLRIPLALHVAYMETHQTSVRRALTDSFNGSPLTHLYNFRAESYIDSSATLLTMLQSASSFKLLSRPKNNVQKMRRIPAMCILSARLAILQSAVLSVFCY